MHEPYVLTNLEINILTDIRWHTFVSRYDNYRFTRALLEYLQKTSFQPNSSQKITQEIGKLSAHCLDVPNMHNNDTTTTREIKYSPIKFLS